MVQVYRIDESDYLLETLFVTEEELQAHLSGEQSLGDDIVTVPIPEGENIDLPKFDFETQKWEIDPTLDINIQLAKIDEEGFYIEPVIVTKKDLILHLQGKKLLEDDIVAIDIPEGLHEPKFNKITNVWEEGRDVNSILDKYREAKIAELDAECTKCILDGFKSSVLGAEHHYSFDMEAQSNFTGTMVLFLSGEITEVEWTTKEGRKIHNLEQFKQLSLEAFVAKDAKIKRFHELKALVNSCQTVDEINAIKWNFGV